MSEQADRESKTEEPTQKRITDALLKGNGPVSRELPLLFTVAATWGSLHLLMGDAASQLAQTLSGFIEHSASWSLNTAADAVHLLQYFSFYGFAAFLPLFATMALAGVAASLPQSNGFILSRIKPDLSRISPAAGWKRLFGKSGLQNGVKALLKLATVGIVAFWSLRGLGGPLMSAKMLEVETQMQMLRAALTGLTGSALLAYLLIALLDVGIAWFTWRRGLRMTKQEIKEESREGEGDPAIKQRQRLLARQRMKKRMIAALPSATVVIVNPTHYAVALRYVAAEAGAPRVVAKGLDEFALRIRLRAEALGVPVVENVPLARALHDQVPVDAFIPPEFYKAIARIIAFLNKPRGKVGT